MAEEDAFTRLYQSLDRFEVVLSSYEELAESALRVLVNATPRQLPAQVEVQEQHPAMLRVLERGDFDLIEVQQFAADLSDIRTG